MLSVRKITGEGFLKEHRALQGGWLLAVFLLAFASANADELPAEPDTDQAVRVASLLNNPMLEADTPRPAVQPVLRSSPPDLLDILDPLPGDPQNQGSGLALAPPFLLVMGPRLQPPETLSLDESVEEPGFPMPEPPRPLDEVVLAQPAAPELSMLAPPQLRPPVTVPPDIMGIPYPMLGAGELTPLNPYKQVRPAKRYALQLRAVLSGVYDDSALISVTGRKPDLILSLVPELALTLGTDQSQAAVKIAYAPALIWYTQGTNKDAVDQNVLLASRYRTGKLLLSLNLSAATATSGGTLDTGQVSESETYLGALTSVYQFSGKTSVDFTLDDTVLKYSGFSDSNEARLQGFANCQYGNFKLGAGALIGLLDTEGDSSQRYIQPLGRVIYASTEKLNFTATAGYEFRSLGEGNGQSSEPVFQIAASYLLLSRTLLTVDVQRHVFASASSGAQNYILTSFNGTIRQGFTGYGRDFFLSLAGGLQHNAYSQIGSGNGSAGGEDNYFYTRVAFDWAMRERCLLGGFYEYSDDSSSRQGSIGFTRNRVGLQLTVIFF